MSSTLSSVADKQRQAKVCCLSDLICLSSSSSSDCKQRNENEDTKKRPICLPQIHSSTHAKRQRHKRPKGAANLVSLAALLYCSSALISSGAVSSGVSGGPSSPADGSDVQVVRSARPILVSSSSSSARNTSPTPTQTSPMVAMHNSFVVGGANFGSTTSSGSKTVRFSTPTNAKLGQTRPLVCHYELRGEPLHAMKVFKDDKEFYRFAPSNKPDERKLAFPVAGVQVDLQRSNENEVWLSNIDKRTSGLYRCQVSVEGTFASVSAERRFEVFDAAGNGNNNKSRLNAWSTQSSAASSASLNPRQRQLTGQTSQSNRAKGSSLSLTNTMGSASSSSSSSPARRLVPVLNSGQVILRAVLSALAATAASRLLDSSTSFIGRISI